MFITYDVSLDLIRSLRDIVPAIKKYDKDLADQLQRAASSVSLNLGEGARSTAGNQRARYESAHASANEAKAALQVAASWGWIDDASAQLAVLDRLLALLWRLTRGCGRAPARRR
jgi:four helix bundle protein